MWRSLARSSAMVGIPKFLKSARYSFAHGYNFAGSRTLNTRMTLGGFSWVSQLVEGPISGIIMTHRTSRSKRRILASLSTVSRSEPRSRRFNHLYSPMREVKTDSSSSGYERLSRPQERTVRGSGGRGLRSRSLQSLSRVTP